MPGHRPPRSEGRRVGRAGPPSEPEPARHLSVTVIGRVATPFTDPATTPIQAQRQAPSPGRVHVDAPYLGGLDGLDGFDYAFLVTYLHRLPPATAPERWEVEPFLLGGSGHAVGVFATRYPHRPNPIGLSLVRITVPTDDGFEFAGVDLLDGTPLLDVKPWVPAFDTPTGPPELIRTGWYEQPGVLDRRGETPSELRR